MSARDVIAQAPSGLKYLDQTMNWRQGVIGSKDADAILSALRSAGWAVVPVEPTAEMLEPFARKLCDALHIPADEPESPHGEWPQWYPMTQHFLEPYKAMLKAAQEDSRG